MMQLGGGKGFKVIREQILTLFKAGPEAVMSLVEHLSQTIDRYLAQVQQQQKTIDEQKNKIQELEQELRRDSHNNDKPPSRDTTDSKQKRKKKRAARKKGKKKRRPGGQKGHPGTTLQMVSDPDKVVVHEVQSCDHCGKSLDEAPVKQYDHRQVFDLPVISVEVTEHRAEHKQCECGHISCGQFPEAMRHKAQYGSRLQANAVYIRNYALLPYDRAAQMFADLFSVPLSAATLVNMVGNCAHELKTVNETIRQGIIDSAVIGCDETGVSINANLQWLHGASTPQLTYLECHAKRGKEAFDAIGILGNFAGTVIHDHCKSYFHYDCCHGLCNAHHLRELIFVYEEYQQVWAHKMIDLLLQIKQALESAVRRGQQRFNAQTCEGYER